MASIANLIISLTAQTASFDSDMKRTSRQQAQHMKKMEKDAAAMGRAVGIAFAAAVTATAVLVKRTIDVADSMQKMAQRTGLTTDALSEYQHVAELSDVTLESFSKGISKMQRSLSDAENGLVTQKRAFDRLGLSVNDLLKLEPDQQFEQIAESISKLESATLRSATAQEIFGRAGTELLSVMVGGKKGIEGMREEAQKLGLTIGQKFADDAAEFNDNLTRIQNIGAGIARTFTQALIPSLLEAQEGFLNMAGGTNLAREAGEKIGSVITSIVNNMDSITLAFKTLASIGVAILVANIATSFVSLGAAVALVGGPIGAAVIAISAVVIGLNKMFGESTKVTNVTGNLETAIRSVNAAWIDSAEIMELINKRQELRAKVVAADIELMKVQEQLQRKSILTGETLAEAAAKGYSSEAGELAILTAQHEKATKAYNDGFAAIGKINARIKELGKGTKGLDEIVVTTERHFSKWDKTIEKMTADTFAELLQIMEELEQQQRDYNKEVQDFIDIGDPMGALMREFAVAVDDANTKLKAKVITVEQYRATLNVLSDQLGRTAAGMQTVAEESDAMGEAMAEGIRILERTFTDLWTGVLDGSFDMFDAIEKGFKAMLANMAQTLITAPLLKELQKLTKGGSLSDFDLSTLGTAAAGIAGTYIGSQLGGGDTGAQTGAAIGVAVGAIVGNIIPVIGTALGAFIGGLLGGWVGGLFDSNRPPVFEASGFSRAGESGSDSDSFVDTVFGRTFTRARRLDAAAIEEFKKTIEGFDNAIGSFLDEDQISAISDVLVGWIQKIEGETLSAEQLLNSRFAAILTTFSADLQKFVNEAEDLQERTERLQVGVDVEKLFEELPQLFGQHTVAEFLGVVDAFQQGTESIIDTFRRVLDQLVLVDTIITDLKSFGGSDLSSDYAAIVALRSETLTATLTRLTSGLDDAIRNFDGSPEQLIQIGNLAQQVRLGEIELLTQIDSIQKGLNANLDRLLADTKATISGPRTAEAILFDARALIDTVSRAQTPEEIAQIGADFEALIRSLSPEDTARFGTSTLAIIEAFQAAANSSLDGARQAVLDSGEAIREMVTGFAAFLDPLTIIASSNERAAEALEAIANGTTLDPDAAFDDAAVIADGIGEAITVGLESQSKVLAEGATNMSNALSSGVSNMSVQLANAIRAGFAGANVNVQVTVQDQGIVTS